MRATVVAVEESDLNAIVWIRAEGSDDDTDAFRVSFQKEGDHVDPEMIDLALSLMRGDSVDLGFVQVTDGETVTKLGRSLARR